MPANPNTPTKPEPSAPLFRPLGQGHTSTPIKKSLQGSEHYASLSRHDVEVLKKNMAGELANQWIGPMPVKDFISTFLPTNSRMPKYDSKLFNVLVKQTHESSMYEPFIKLVTTKASKVIEGFKLVNTSQYEDPTIVIPGMKNKPDLSCYKTGCKIDPKKPTRYEDMELIFEFKPPRDGADPFEDDPRKADPKDHFPFEPEAEVRRQCRGQLACYARVWCARQHRTHCFVVWIGDPHARIIRFDRSGAIVSAKFNYRTNGDLLKFLWNFSHTSDVIRGLDESVTKASPSESKTVRDELSEWTPSSTRSVFKVQVPDPEAGPNGDKERKRPFFVWGPLADPRSVTGRATRGYPAWDPKEECVVFLKDSWRSSEPGMEKEVDILRELNDAKCRNIPDLVCGDDLDQATETKKYANKTWNIGAKADKFVQRVHTRFVERNVGSHITSKWQMDKMNAKMFLRIVFDAFIGHWDAYVKCGILHRDISAGNILVDADGHGFLNDWDLSKHIGRDNVARQLFRSGTWQFMSADLLTAPKKLNGLHHDLESFFWVILYHILRYLRHSLPADKLEDKMRNIFDSQIDVQYGELPEGGHVKNSMFTNNNPLGDHFEVTDNTAMTSFFRENLQHWKIWYQYPSGSNRDHFITLISTTQNISREQAMEMYPETPNHLAMGSHNVMAQLFKEAFAKDDQWPAEGTDFFVDRLAEPQKRKRDADDGQDQSAVGNGVAAKDGNPSGKPRPKKNLKQKNDAEYKNRSGKPAPPLGTRQ